MKKRPLTGLKVVCYYGCLLVRPPKVTGAKNYENPEEMDRLMALMGAEADPLVLQDGLLRGEPGADPDGHRPAPNPEAFR